MKGEELFPALDPVQLVATRDALHAYARILGSWSSTCRVRRKHWWHASLRPSISGVTTGVIYTDNTHFEVVLNFRDSVLLARTATGDSMTIELLGQAASGPARQLSEFLQGAGVATELASAVNAIAATRDETRFAEYSPEQARRLLRTLSAVTSALHSFRAGIPGETSPIQLWPHHFDLAMLWLPGEKIAGQDPDDEERSDKQMNFGFTFGDEGIPEPYFYVTAYPSPQEFGCLELPGGTRWQTDGFTGAVLTYQRLLDELRPAEYLLALWTRLLSAGRQSLLDNINKLI